MRQQLYIRHMGPRIQPARLVAAGSEAAIRAAVRLYGPLVDVTSQVEWHGALRIYRHDYHAGWYRPDQRGNRSKRVLTDFYLYVSPEPEAVRSRPEPVADGMSERCHWCDSPSHSPAGCTSAWNRDNPMQELA